MTDLDAVQHLVAPGIHPGAYVQATDPALDSASLVAPGKLWVDTAGGPPYEMKVRNASDTAWDGVGTTGTGTDLLATTVLLDGFGYDIPPGVWGDVSFGYSGTLVFTQAELIEPDLGTRNYIWLDFWRDGFAHWPPTEDDTITGRSIFTGDPVGLWVTKAPGVSPVANLSPSSATPADDRLNAGDVIRINVRENNGARKVLVTFVTRRG